MESKVSCRINIRVYHDPWNRRTFKKFTIEECPIFKNVKEAKRCFLDTYEKDFEVRPSSPNSVELGFIGYFNAKNIVATEADLKKAYESGTVHKDGFPLFFIALSNEKQNPQPGKRKYVDTSSSDEGHEEKAPPKPKAAKRKTESERIDRIVERLKTVNGDKWASSDYRLWAVSLDRGLHESYTTPPQYPYFKSKERGAASKTLSQASTSKHTAVSIPRRTELLAQLKTIGELKKDDVLTEDEYQEILEQLKEIK